MQSVGVNKCGDHGVWGLGCVGIGVCGGWDVYGHILGELWGVYKLIFCLKPEIFCFPFPIFANLTLEFCYDQTNDPGTLRIVLKDAYLY